MTKQITPDPYPWKKEYELDDKFFDTQTKKFLEIINLMKGLVARGVEGGGISEVFFQLVHYFERYMLQEEIYLKELHYNSLDQHCKSHREFSKRIISFREGFEKGEKGFTVEMYEYLEKWFDVHIMVDDRSAVEFIKNHQADSSLRSE